MGFICPILHVISEEFPTSNKKANFIANTFNSISLGNNQFLLMTIRTHDQYNTTVYGLDDRYRGVYGGRHVIFINPNDIRKQNLSERTKVKITSHFTSTVRTVNNFQLVPYEIPEGCLAGYFPELNPLVPLESFADKSKTPTSKSVVVTLEAQ